MIGFAKVAALGAALSFSAVTAYDLPVRKLEAAVGGKYQDRILPSSEGAAFVSKASVATTGSLATAPASGRGDRLAPSQGNRRTTTVESRLGANVSVVTRVAPATVANR